MDRSAPNFRILLVDLIMGGPILIEPTSMGKSIGIQKVHQLFSHKNQNIYQKKLINSNYP